MMLNAASCSLVLGLLGAAQGMTLLLRQPGTCYNGPVEASCRDSSGKAVRTDSTGKPVGDQAACEESSDGLTWREGVEGDAGKSYRGLVDHAASGRKCMRWTEVEEGVDVTSPGLGNHAYCRNPDDSMDKPWCYVVDPAKAGVPEACNVEKCTPDGPFARDFHAEAAGVADTVGSGALDCKCAKQLYGSTTTTADTSVSLVEKRAEMVLFGTNSKGEKCVCKQ